MVPPEAAALLGRVLESKLELTHYLGGGAVGFVFQAHHRTLNKRVAIKVLQSSIDMSPGSKGRFATEAQTAAQFDHPNSVRVLDFGRDPLDGLLYIAMEFLEGRDVSQILKDEGPIDSLRTCR
jgi:eukaryotic-like serine/threonine-protein kinase